MLLKRLKKRLVIVFVFIAVSVTGSFLYFLPQPIIQHPEEAQIWSVSYKEARVAMFDEKEIIHLLSEYKCRRAWKDYSPYYNYGEIQIEIDGLDSNDPLHIQISENTMIFYISADRTIYEIIDEDEDLKDRIMPLLTIE